MRVLRGNESGELGKNMITIRCLHVWNCQRRNKIHSVKIIFSVITIHLVLKLLL